MMARVKKMPAGQKAGRCAYCGADRNPLSLYLTASGRVCRPCLVHVNLFTDAPASKGA